MAEPIRVVIVDDDDDVRELLRLRLERDGAFVVVGEGADGQEGAGVCASTQPDVLILDATMPGGGGLASVPDARRASPHTIVVIYTSASGVQVRNEAERVGAHAVVGKLDPFELLLGTIYRFLPDRAPPDPTKEKRDEFGHRMSELLDKEGSAPAKRVPRSKKNRVGLLVVLVLVVLPALAFIAWVIAQLAGAGISF